MGWYGSQRGRVCLKERKLGVRKPRLREKDGGEAAIPAYAAMQDANLGRRMLDVLMRGQLEKGSRPGISMACSMTGIWFLYSLK